MLDVGRMEKAVSRRARALRGFRVAGIALAGAALVTLAGACAARGLGARPGAAAFTAAATVCVGAAAVGYALGRLREPCVPDLFLSLDLALGTGELLCSLHEVRARRGDDPFRERISQKLESAPLPWRRVMRPRARDLAPWLVALFVLGAAAAVVFALPGGTRATRVEEERQTRAAASDSGPVVRSDGQSTREGDVAVRADSQPGAAPEPLVDTLAEILPAPPSRGLLAGALASEDAGAESLLSRDAGGSVSEFLSQIARRAQADARSALTLTEEEKEALRALLAEMPRSPLRDSLSAVLESEPGDALKDRLAESQRLLDSAGASEDHPGNAGIASAPPESGERAQGDEPDSIGWAPVKTSPQGRTGMGAGERTPAELGNAPPSGADSAPATDEGGAAAGRTEPSGAAAALGTAGLTPEVLLGSLGREGSVKQFLTKGVPFEPPAAAGPDAMATSYSFVRLQALLESRSVAAQVRDLVREYFEGVTEVGP